MIDEKKTSGSEVEITPSEVSDERREFLKKCGKFAAYTAPAIATLLLFDKKQGHAAGSQPLN
jgi:hypothetical protein